MTKFKTSFYSLLIIFGGLILASVTASIVSASKGSELMKIKNDILVEKELNRELVQKSANKASLFEIKEKTKNHMEAPHQDNIEYLQGEF